MSCVIISILEFRGRCWAVFWLWQTWYRVVTVIVLSRKDSIIERLSRSEKSRSKVMSSRSAFSVRKYQEFGYCIVQRFRFSSGSRFSVSVIVYISVIVVQVRRGEAVTGREKGRVMFRQRFEVMVVFSRSGDRSKKIMTTFMKRQRWQSGFTVCQSNRAKCWDITMASVIRSFRKSVRIRLQRKVRKDERVVELSWRAFVSIFSVSILDVRFIRQKEVANQGEAIRRRFVSVMFVGRKQGFRALSLGYMVLGGVGTVIILFGSGLVIFGGRQREELLVIRFVF